MFTLKMLAAPVIGAIIGYCTNWIAVKMLFRPRYPKYLFGKKLPLTPGIIPKGKNRLAASLGKAVGEQLITNEIMEEVLLSDEMRSKLLSELDTYTDKWAEQETTLFGAFSSLAGEEAADSSRNQLECYVSSRIEGHVLNMNVGNIVAERVMDAAREKVKGSMLALVVTDGLLDSLSRQVADSVNEYAEQNAKGMIDAVVKSEFDSLASKPMGSLVSSAVDTGIDIGAIVVSIYENLVKEKLPSILSAIDFDAITRKRIEDMPVEEVEELVLSVMKKELSAVVNLGALIGFILGLFNLFFYA